MPRTRRGKIQIAECGSCTEPNTSEMVQCDTCKLWYHFGCVEVDASVADRSWSCATCTLVQVSGTNICDTGKDPANDARQNTMGQDGGAEGTSGQAMAALYVQRGSLTGEERRPASISSSKRKSARAARLELQRLEEQRELDAKYMARKYELLALADQDSSDDEYNSFDADSCKSSLEKQTKAELPKAAVEKVSDKSMLCESTRAEVKELTQSQLSARQVLVKELPTFSGRPEEWAVFISNYQHSTELCGFTDSENLIRLQRALKGRALEAVGGQLLHPSTVQEVISTLKMHFGRPEAIIRMQINKIKAQPPPKAERLETVIAFALSVRQLYATMEATGLVNHINNPILLQELVDKLPSAMRLNWAVSAAELKQRSMKEFSEWLNAMAEAASSVTLLPLTEWKNDKRVGQLHAHTEDKPRPKEQLSVSNDSRGCFACKQNHKLLNCETFKNLPCDKKWDLVNSRSICECCLKHTKRLRCKETRYCGLGNCRARHHMLLHDDESEPGGTSGQIFSAHQCELASDIWFGVVPVTLHGGGRSVDTFAFFDSGSSMTLLEDELAKALKLKGVRKRLCLKWTGDVVRAEDDSEVVSLEISARRTSDIETKRYRLKDVRTTMNLGLPLQTFNADDAQQMYAHLKGIPLPSYEDARPTILIGLQNQHLSLPLKMREGRFDEPVAMKTRLGWLVSGCTGAESTGSEHRNYHHYEACDCDRLLHNDVGKFLMMDSCVNEKAYFESSEEKRAMNILKTTTANVGDRYECGLLWRYDNVNMPDSYAMAMKRLQCLEKKIRVQPEILSKLNSEFKNLLDKGYARILEESELRVEQPREWYLPTFIVTNSNKPGKVRLVWDAAAKSMGVSLNTMLLKGPDQLAALPAVLYTFRSRKIAVCGDISEMFHQVRVRKEDQPAQRFLWRDGDSERRPDVYQMEVLTFGASCSPSVAQYIKNYNANIYADKYPRASIAITEHHYVDDFLDSLDTIDETINLAKEVRFIHSKAGFRIRNWLSNSCEVVRALGEARQGDKQIQLVSDPETNSNKVLGLWWKTETDIFTFSLRFTKAQDDVLTGTRMPTKRELLRILMSVFDPLGFLAFYLVILKALLQEVWKSGVDWDEVIPDRLHQQWNEWLRLLPRVEDVMIPRCYSSLTAESNTSIQLHIFVDASESAMAAVAYFRISNGSTVQCALVGAKTKIAPVLPISIPRMELQAAVLGARLAEFVTANHKLHIQKRVFWTDSRTVKSWFRSDPKRYNQFVMFRISEVLQKTKVSEWRWLPTKVNVADDATKWAKTPSFRQDSRWFTGPSFLYDSEELWPEQPDEQSFEQQEEIRPRFVFLHCLAEESFIDFDRFSTWEKLHRTTSWIVRVVDNLKKKCCGMESSTGALQAAELERAHTLLIRIAQIQTYGDEVAVLTNGGSLKKGYALWNCSPYLDENGLLRIRGRIDNASCIEHHTKRPIIMPKGHRVTELIVDFYHRAYHHRCNETVLNEIRQRYWIPKLRVCLKSVCRRCQRCRIDKAKPRYPEMAPLPAARLAAYIRPFTYVGMDYFGPINVVIGRRTEKRWGALFTCLTIRAVHLELAHGLSADSCIMCIRNFIARRGKPREIYSDNGTNFKGAEKELREALQTLDINAIKKGINTMETQWFFNPPSAPHMGGCWERLVGSVKNVLKEVIGKQQLRDETLLSTLIEVESIINTRPLTYVALDCDNAEVLTPNHFLLGSSDGTKPPGTFDTKDLMLRKSWRKCQKLADMFWSRWVREYLPSLTRRAKWFATVKPVKKGDVVVIIDESLPRGMWPKGVVIDTVTAKDGQVRRATVKTSSGVYVRPVVKLAVLDVKGPKEDESTAEQLSHGEENVDND